KLERARPYGLRNGVVVKNDPQVFAAAVHEWTGGHGVNVVIDLVGATYLEANLSAVARKGRIVLVSTTAGAKATLDFGVVMGKRLTVTGTVLRSRSAEDKATATRLFAEQVIP